jgi:8-oxo-dGTP pyrophosphatase MutT (NUDIX family)
MIKKIFAGNVVFYLASRKKAEKLFWKLESSQAQLINIPSPDSAHLKDLINQFEGESVASSVLLTSPSMDKLLKVFFEAMEPVNAAGGVVINSEKELLMIYRRGKWDLPKGKMEKDEHPGETAIREVMEETGVNPLQLKKQIKFLDDEQDCTYHIYHEGGRHIIKSTYWFKMKCSGNPELIPQTKEDITKAIWADRQIVEDYRKNSYPLINDVLSEVL